MHSCIISILYLNFSFHFSTLHKKKLTISNRSLTSFSDSPLYLEVNVDEDTLKKVVLHSVATAFASIVFPVPGGPTINTPFQGLRIPLKHTLF